MRRITINKYIVSDPKICHGKLTFKGSRVMVWQILDMLAHEETVKDILKDYPSLTKGHIRAALEYAGQVTQQGIFIPRQTHEITS